ncbi:Sec-independent protein translocase subunit TatA [Saccharopolyspora sp. ID03-671]|uniref:Sec-independent protein translocase subunit TatA n=1 Tax=Saccharopolyspora sp. ID03-671 TaxID=3073066 RepID=UPI00324E2B7B
MGSLSAWHWLIVLIVVALLFGSSKLPQVARSLGQSARVLRAEARGLREDEEAANQRESGTSRPASDAN